MDKPLVSFNLLCYNQEAFIREAIAGAFSQTYSPLEIIISDDCSKDRTFEIACQMAAAYKGPHTVRLNRNSTNLGLAGNSNQSASMCRGELIVGAAGDDISVPERVSIIVEAWNDSGRKATCLFSRFSVIDEAGHVLEGPGQNDWQAGRVRFVHEQGAIPEFIRRRTPHVPGCAQAISRRLYDVFGPFPETVVLEDTTLAFRAVLAGGWFTRIDATLVKYRRHGQNITFDLQSRWSPSVLSFDEFGEKCRCELDRMIAGYRSFLTDAERARQHGLISSERYPTVRKAILKEAGRFELKQKLLTQSWLQRCFTFAQLYCNTIRPRELLTQIPHLLPKALQRAGFVVLSRKRASG